MQETQETQVWSLGREDPLEKKIVTHSSIFAWKFPWTEEPGGLLSMSDWAHTHTQTHTHMYNWITLLYPETNTILQINCISTFTKGKKKKKRQLESTKLKSMNGVYFKLTLLAIFSFSFQYYTKVPNRKNGMGESEGLDVSCRKVGRQCWSKVTVSEFSSFLALYH